MALTNVDKDTEYINKLVEIKRYYRSESKFDELLQAADKALNESDYTDTWRKNRSELTEYLTKYFQLDQKVGSYVKFTESTDLTNNNSYNYTIEIGKSPVKPKYAIGSGEVQIETVSARMEELSAKFGLDYKKSTEEDFVSVEERLGAIEELLEIEPGNREKEEEGEEGEESEDNGKD